MAKWPADQQAGFLAWLAKNREERVASGKLNYIAVAAPVDQPSVWPLQEWYEEFMNLSKVAPNWLNKITVESLETHIMYQPISVIERVSPTPLLMIIASDDIITPTGAQKEAFERAQQPKKLVVVQGHHFDAYNGPKHDEFVLPAVQWFKTYLMPQ